MSIYKPTWLYIKQHNQTGLKYFGKTTRKDPTKYLGSGLHWVRHLKKHGKDITTIWYQLFENKTELTEFALKFSKENNIVESEEWANLVEENGIAGGTPSDHTRAKLRAAKVGYVPWNKGLTKNTDSRVATNGLSISKVVKGKKKSKEHREKLIKILTANQYRGRSKEKGPKPLF